ncbi:OmpA/MotB family protein [Hydrogenovibrio kuenenii]|uniref:OmpA/MotB family protein n=1 Tax=Hydrogenovibrio kuenenii TaxID=63658 RepID=UPI000463F524|nr:OmpA family protein [Hydrogenovibrio kuenenii]
MSSVKSEKIKSGWLFSFGDMITLLITFFILMIVLNKGEISKVQKWLEDDLDQVSIELTGQFQDAIFVKVKRTSLGVEIDINNDQAFVEGGFNPSEGLAKELTLVGEELKKIPLLTEEQSKVLPAGVAYDAKKQGLNLRREISIAGYTDNAKINPESSLRNNWFLSTMRAESVMQLLMESSGLPQKLFGIAGYGMYRPIASNDTPDGRAKNRRVKIVITANFTHQSKVEEKSS